MSKSKDLILQNIEEQKFWNNNEIWEEDGEEWSRSFGGTEKLWQGFIFPKIESYLKGVCIEIAPGHGRMTSQLLSHFSKIYIVDMNENCIKRCKERFSASTNLSYHINDGMSLSSINDNSVDFVFSWDSFVHMQKFVIENYLSEISKKLRIGGVGAIHHSFLFGGDEVRSFRNKQGRSNFTPDIFKHMSEQYNLEIIKQDIFKFNELHDCFSIFRKGVCG